MQKDTRKKLIKDILRIFLVTVFFGAAAFLLRFPSVQEIFDIQQWRAHSQQGRNEIVFIGVFTLAIGCGFPRIATSAIAGALYGAVYGTFISQITVMLGATLNFLMGRWVLRGPIKRRLPGRFKVWYDRFSENGFKWIFYVRLFPLSNAVMVNLLCGASRVGFPAFLGATFLGYLPFTIAFALFGSSAAKDKTFQLVLGAGLLVAVLAGRWLYKRLRPMDENGS